MAKKSNLFQKMVVEFGGEEDIDVGALTIECFTKFFEIVKSDLFETVKSELFSISSGLPLDTAYFRASILLFTPLVRNDNTKF